ncbi:hypothetical protein NitaMp045 (mitochondrion) [Nicotiana tabacum]|uniref:Uncharacterized protein n=1 Tax=Nicotiana tabacum TaxID=4097 RepID=Q5MA23_TOBAC|nr:hypothetical protein NitaMp045 [Nicotiana tabacum]BAD83455.1 hypothetical protein [Nicotiana tabacum]
MLRSKEGFFDKLGPLPSPPTERGILSIKESQKSRKSLRNEVKKAASKEKSQLQFKRIGVSKRTVRLRKIRFKREKNKADVRSLPLCISVMGLIISFFFSSSS